MDGWWWCMPLTRALLWQGRCGSTCFVASPGASGQGMAAVHGTTHQGMGARHVVNSRRMEVLVYPLVVPVTRSSAALAAHVAHPHPKHACAHAKDTPSAAAVQRALPALFRRPVASIRRVIHGTSTPALLPDPPPAFHHPISHPPQTHSLPPPPPAWAPSHVSSCCIHRAPDAPSSNGPSNRRRLHPHATPSATSPRTQCLHRSERLRPACPSPRHRPPPPPSSLILLLRPRHPSPPEGTPCLRR